jgi:hypothetical protein
MRADETMKVHTLALMLGMVVGLGSAEPSAAQGAGRTAYPADFQISVAGKGAFLLREDSKLYYCYFVGGGQMMPSKCTKAFQLPRERSSGEPISYRITSDDKLSGTLSVISSFGSYYQCEGTSSSVVCTRPAEIPW